MAYIPGRGDMVWINLNPQAGHEQAGRRPALVLSPEPYNAKVGLAIFCPITNQAKGYPFEVPISVGLAVTGVVFEPPVKSIDSSAKPHMNYTIELELETDGCWIAEVVDLPARGDGLWANP